MLILVTMQRSDKLLILLFPLLLYLFSLGTLIFNTDFYTELFLKTNVDQEKAQELTTVVFDYLKNNDFDPPRLPFLTEKENSHMRDVKVLVTLHFVVFVFLLLLFVILFSRSTKKQIVVRYGSIISIILPIVFAVFDFSSVFTLFHAVFFPQGNWVFPATSVLVNVYTFEFFKLFVANTILRAEVISTILLLISFKIKHI